MNDLKKVVENIKTVKVQGAKEIAVYSLKFLKKFCKKYGFGKKFEIVSEKLEKVRPTAVVLHNCLKVLRKERSLKTIDRLLTELNTATEKIARNGSRLIKDGFKIMSHCHSSESLAVIKQAWKEGKKIEVITTVTEPLEQGVKSAKELAKLKIPVTLIIDSATGHFIKDVDCVIVGCDAIRTVWPTGIINKIGTRNLALSAKKDKKPFIVVGNTFKIDKRREFEVEERPTKEIYGKLLTPIDIKKIKIRNPAFDVTELDLVTYIVTEKDVFTPKEFMRF